MSRREHPGATAQMFAAFSDLFALATRVVDREEGAVDVLVDALLERGVLDPGDRASMKVRARRWASGCILVGRRPQLFRRAIENARSGERTLVVTTWRVEATRLGHLRDSDARVPQALRFSWVEAVEAMCRSGSDDMLRESAVFMSPEAAKLLGARDLRRIGPIVVEG
jgi:hypothetical protein